MDEVKDFIEPIERLCGKLKDLGFENSSSEKIFYYNSAENSYRYLEYNNWKKTLMSIKMD